MHKFYNATNDAMFKAIFTNPNNEDLLTSLLETILKTKVKILKLLPPEKIKKHIRDKGKTLDVLIEAENKIINIELNADYYSNLHRRNAAYIFNNYIEDLESGEDYINMHNHIQINLTNNLPKEYPLVKIYKLIDNKEKKEFIDNLIIYEFNLNKIKEMCYNKGNQEYKLLAALSCNEEELDNLSKNDKLLEKFKGEVMRMNKNRKFANFMDQEEEARKLHNTLMAEATMKGVEQGLEQGENNSKLEIALNMKKDKVDIDTIIKYTNLSKAEIENLK